MPGIIAGQWNLSNNHLRRHFSYPHQGQLLGVCVIHVFTPTGPCVARRRAHEWLMLCCAILKFLILFQQEPCMFTLHVSSSLQSL